MDELLAVEVNRAARMHEYTAEVLAGVYQDNLRSRLFGAFMSVCLSHHEAILLLVQNDDLGGSALALLRPLVESAYRGAYVGVIATDAEVQKIADGKSPYPKFDDLASRLDGHMATGTIYQSYGGATWGLMNDLTHTGVVQLAGRLGTDGGMGSHYDPEILRGLVVSATSALLRIALPFLIHTKGQEAAARVSAAYSHYYPLPASTMQP